MKKIGILFGQEYSFPPAFVERVNQKTGGKEIVAEFVRIDKVIQGEPCGYDVVIDRISQDVPFYRAWLKNEALTGCAVVNNPFWWSADDKFFNNALATKVLDISAQPEFQPFNFAQDLIPDSLRQTIQIPHRTCTVLDGELALIHRPYNFDK